MGNVRIGYILQVRKPKGKRPLGRLRPTWKDKIQTDHKEIRWVGVDRISLVQD
jgi:hypothetical protein